MSSSEAYLDSLLSALNEEQNSESTVEQEIIEEIPSEAEIEVIEEPKAVEEEKEIQLTPISDDQNKALSADEIAALFAQANVNVETGDEIVAPESEEPVAVAEELESVEETAGIEKPETVEVEEEIRITPISDDPNKALSADEIAALFAQANVDIETGDEIVAPESEEPETVEVEEEIRITPSSDDPNKALSADEIAALFAQADVDMVTGDSVSADYESETVQEEIAEEISIDDMLAQMEDEDVDSQEKSAEPELDIQNISEEIEIDMDNPEEIELLLGLGERPDWSARKAEAEMNTEPEEEESEEFEMEEEEQPIQTAEEILAAMSDENSDLQEINSLLNKLDNNELVGDGIEESVLVDFAETDFDSEQDPWLDELLGNIEGKQKGKKKRARKKFSLFGRKKKEDEIQKENLSPEIEAKASAQDTEAVTEILHNFSEDNSEIPVDLFAASEEEESEEELDLIALVEADNVKKATKEKKSGEGKGFFAKIWNALTEEVPEEEEKESKEKKEKKNKKAKKRDKKAVTDAEDNEGILEELDAEEDTAPKNKKAKKAKKEKKQKPMDEASLIDSLQDSKKLPMKMVLRIFALCCSIMVLVLLVNQFVPKLWSLADARNAFYKRDYETTYQEMSGKKLSESDQRLYEKAKIILQLNHKLDAYGNYKKMNMPVEALDSLLAGYLLWQNMGDKITEYDAVSETEEIKLQIVDTLSAEYQISEQEAEEINALSDYDYTLKLEEMTGSLSRQNSIFDIKQEEAGETPLADMEMQQTEQNPQAPTENVLPEEEVQ